MAHHRWLTADQQRVWRVFLQATNQLREQLDRDLQRDSGLSLADYQTLAMLSEAPARTLRMSDLAAQTWSSRSRLSHAVDRLEARGWVARVSCPSDKRGAYAHLTDAGFAVLEAAAPTHVESVQRHVFDHLGAQGLDALGRISGAIAQRLEAAALAEHAPAELAGDATNANGSEPLRRTATNANESEPLRRGGRTRA
ncbi:MAG: hypothetical protein NVSMB2_23310 [Chloroflexota bacterium]